MYSPTDVRGGLVDLAEQVKPLEGYETRVMDRARRLRVRRRLATGAASGLCAVVLLTMARLLWLGPTPQLAAAPPDGPFLSWSPVGSVDTDLVRAATDAWNHADAGGPHAAVRALVATKDVDLQSIVVLQGYDKEGAPRLAFFTGDTSAAGALRLRADRPAPDPANTRVISLVSPRLTSASRMVSSDPWGTYAIAVAMPGVTAVQISSTAIDEELRGEPDASTSRLVVQKLPLAATAETTTIMGFIKPQRVFASATKVFEVHGEDGADGDAVAVPGEVISRTGQQVVVTFPKSRPVQQGQLAVVKEGLVGRVTAVDVAHGEATIDLVTSTGFTGEVYTNISNVPGSVRGTGDKLVMERIPAGGEVYQGNRVLMPDPSQRSNQVGAVTIGRASAEKAADASTVELTPTANLSHFDRVSIMTPSSGGSR